MKILVKAAETGDLIVIKRLIALEKTKNKSFVLANEDRWKNVFFVACGKGYHPIVSLLLRHGLNGDSCDGGKKTALMYACEKGKDAIVKLLIKSKRGSDVNLDACDENGRTALILSCINGHLSTVKILLHYCIHIDARDKDGKNAFIHACCIKLKDNAVCSYLIDRNINIDACDNGGRTPLMYACLLGNDSLVSLLVDCDACTDTKDKKGNTALIYAVLRKWNKCVMALSYSNLDYNVQGSKGRTALIHAVIKENKEVVEALLHILDDGMCIKDQFGKSALLYACINDSFRIAELLIEHGTFSDACNESTFWYDILRYCCKNGKDSIVKLFIKHGLNLDYFHQNEHPKQPLMVACSAGETQIVNVMVKHGVRTDDYDAYGKEVFINAFDLRGRTALMFACKHGNLPIVKILTRFNGLDVQARDSNGKTALMYACEMGYLGIVKHLLELSPRMKIDIGVNIQDVECKTALIHACINEYDKIVSSLVAHGADVNICDSQGNNALIYACDDGFNKIVYHLLKAEGIDTNYCVPENGMNALMVACRYGYEKIVNLLLNHRHAIDLNCVDNSNDSALLHAALGKHAKIVDILLQHNAGANNVFAFMCACLDDQEKIVSSFIKHNVDVQVRMGCGKTVFVMALQQQSTKILPLLIGAGHEILNTDLKGKTSFMTACEFGNVMVAKLLLAQYDIDVNAWDMDGKTALIYASMTGQDAIVELLLKDDKLDVNACDCHNRTALIHASQKGYDKVVRLLVTQSRIEIDSVDTDKKTALMYACCEFGCEFENVVKTLVSHGASCLREDVSRQSAIMYAFSFRTVDARKDAVIETLLTSMCNSQSKNYDWQLALGYACRAGLDEIVKTLVMDKKDPGVGHIHIDFRFGVDAMSPLLWACKIANKKLVQILIKHCDCDVNFSDCSNKTPLMYAAEEGLEQIVNCLIKNGGDLAVTDEFGKTALIHAVEAGHEDLISMLLYPGIDVDLDALLGDVDTGETALMYACRMQDEELIDKLLKLSCADVNAQDVNERTALMHVCWKCHSDAIVKRLLMEPDIRVNLIDGCGKTALIYACESCDRGLQSLSIIQALVDAGADLSYKDPETGKTALMYLCKNPVDLVSQVTSETKVHIDIQDDSRKTVLMYAIENGHIRSSRLLVMYSNEWSLNVGDVEGKTALLYASEKGLDDVVGLLIKRRCVDLNACDQLGKTALMYGSEKGYYKIVKLLKTSAGVNVNAQDHEGVCALMYACQAGEEKVVKQLIRERNVDVNRRDSHGQTCLMRSCKRGHETIVGILLEHGADIKVQDNSENSALFYAASNGHERIVALLRNLLVGNALKSLRHKGDKPTVAACIAGYDRIVSMMLERGVSCNAKDSRNGKSLLMYACELGHMSIVKTLVRNNSINLNGKDDQGRTALMYACLSKHADIAELLLNYQASVDMQDNAGKTALIYCCQNGPARIVHHLLRFCANVNIRDNDGHTAFWYCCPYWMFDVTDWMLDGGRNMDNKDGSHVIITDPTDEDLEAIEAGFRIEIVYLLVKECISINVFPKSGETLLMFSAAYDMYSNMKRLLVRTDVDFDMTDEHGRTVFSHALEGRGLSLELLLESGKLFDTDGSLKAVHKNAVINIENVSFNALYIAMENRLFSWDWCPREFVKRIGLVALDMGFCPGSVADGSCDQGAKKISPIMAACLDKDVAVVRVFLKNFYFLPEDCVPLCNFAVQSLRNQNNEADTNWHEKIPELSKSQPLSLEALSTVTVSKAISLAGCPTKRAVRVDTLPLPALLKDRLSFNTVTRVPDGSTNVLRVALGIL